VLKRRNIKTKTIKLSKNLRRKLEKEIEREKRGREK